MAAYEVLLLNTTIPQIQAAQSGDTYVVPRDIAFSTVANLANGTYLLPSLTFSSDPDTGIFRQGANALGFTAGGGSDQMVLTSTGLGIGTSSPSVRLQTNATINTAYSASNTLAGGVITYIKNASVTNSTDATIRLEATGSASVAATSISAVHTGDGASALTFGTRTNPASGVTEKMRLDSSGNVGIGTDSPGSKLHVDGAAGSGGGDVAIRLRDSTSTNTLQMIRTGATYSYGGIGSNEGALYSANTLTLCADSSSVIKFAAGGSERARITSGGDFLVGTTSTVGKVTINDGALAFAGNATAPASNVGIYRGGAADNLIFATGGSERARITSGGIFQVSSGGSVQVGGTAARATTAGTNRLDIFDGTAPVGTLTNGISIYSSSGEAYVMDAAGNATLFSPHDAETNEWIFKSKHTPTGKVLKIDVERLLKFINDHFGLDAVHEFVEE